MSTPEATATSSKLETPLAQVSTKWASDFILRAMFYRFLGARPEKDEQLKAAYEKRFGRKMMPHLPTDKDHAVYLEGEPGQGKTQGHLQAARDFAGLMGMKFHEEVSQSDLRNGKITKDDFVFSIIELAGETSNKEVFGLMAKMKIGDQEFMGHLPDWRLASTLMAGYAYVLFDDFATSTHQVQNSCLGLLLNGTAGDLQFNLRELSEAKTSVEKDGTITFELPEGALQNIVEPRHGSSTVHFGLAGNYGTRDGNKTFPITTATSTRVIRFGVSDTLDAYVERSLTNKYDETGDAHLCGFLKQYPEHFNCLAKPENGILPQMPVSRSWDIVLPWLRREIYEHGGLAAIAKMDPIKSEDILYNLEIIAGGCVGKKAASSMGAFYNTLFIGAAPIADDIIRLGKVDVELIAERYNDGHNIDGQNFGISLASALSNFASADLQKLIGPDAPEKNRAELTNTESETSIKVREVIKNFSYGINQFPNQSMATFAIDQLMRRLAVVTPVMFDRQNSAIPKPECAILLAMGLLVDNQKYIQPENKGAVIDALTNYAAIIGDAQSDKLTNKLKNILK